MKNACLFKLLSIIIFINGIQVFSQETDNKPLKSDPSVPIFEIKNDIGQTVFAPDLSFLVRQKHIQNEIYCRFFQYNSMRI